MAVRFDGVDGNQNVTLDGAWNAGGPVSTLSYLPAFAGATALTVAFTIQPDPGSLHVPSGWDDTRALTHCGCRGTAHNVFRIYSRGGAAAGQIGFHVYGLDGSLRAGLTTGAEATLPLVEGQVCRLLLRWRAAPEAMAVTVNGQAVPVTLGGDGPIAALYANLLANLAPLELGAMSGADLECVAGRYQQWAVWDAYLSDADAVSYGRFGDPGRLSVAPLYWVTLTPESITPLDAAGQYAPGVSPPIGHLRDARTGVDYSAVTGEYSYGGPAFEMPCRGVFSLFTIVADLPAAVGHLIEDGPSLPIEWFELEELNGRCGRRSGTLRRIPQDYSTWAAAAAAAQYGDDIVIDHTYTGLTMADSYFPAKTFDTTTPRMPPHQKRPLTMGRPLTSAH